MAFPPPENRRTLAGLRQVMADLRNPDGGCPWDVAQDHASIARYAIEEAYEVVDAIDHGTDADLRDELGDLLLQVVFHAQMAEERGAFTFGDVVEAIVSKMVRRHPHVYGDGDERSAHEQTTAWEEIKAQERAAKAGPDAVPSLLDDVPVGLPGLTRTEKLTKRVARAGFDWNSAGGVIAKIKEELAEVEEALADGDAAAIEDEIGDLLLTAANLTRFLGLDGEALMRKGNEKFSRRFRAVEAAVRASGRPFEDHNMDELQAYWDAAKASEHR